MARRGENIYRRKDGRWEGRYKCCYSKDGKAKYRSVYGHTYAEVKQKLIQSKVKPVSSYNTCCLTVKELSEEWLSAVRLQVKASTIANYQMKVDKHILPEFGGLRYDMLTVQRVNSFIQNKLDSGLSAKYVSDIIIVFKTMAKYVSKVRSLRNILADVTLPKAEKKETILLTRTQQAQLVRYLRDNLNSTALCVLLSLYTGLRVGEICGLMWGDVDFQKSCITVRRTIQRIHTGSGTAVVSDTPKSLKSRRCIPVPASILKILRMFRSSENYYILSGGEKATEPRTLQRRFRSLLKKAGLPSVKYHSLRHAFATNCLQAGFDVKTLSEILGHASVETTLNRYVHTSMDRMRACMTLLESAVSKVFQPSDMWSVSNSKTPVLSQSLRR